MREPLPVTLLTGFLGAGKTTLLRHLLAAPTGLRIGVILNEFGEAGIDQVEAAERAYIEISQGCACCLRNPDLVDALRTLSQRGDLDRVIVETSGLADPLPLTWTIGKPELDGHVRLDAVVTVVDALLFERAAREEWEAQVRCADVLVVGKRDLASAAQLAAVEVAVREVNPDVRLVEGGPDVPVSALLDVDAPRAPLLDRPAAQHSDFGGLSLDGGAAFDPNALEDLLETLPTEVFRAKGIARTTRGWLAFHVVGGRVTVDPTAPAPPHGDNRILLFGRALDRPALRALFDACRAAK